jgi:hypothetical protein
MKSFCLHALKLGANPVALTTPNVLHRLCEQLQGLTGILFIALFFAATAITSPAQTITSLDDPNAGTASGQGTAAVAINTAGTITGGYVDKNNVGHGFVRSASGVYTTFDVPGAGITAPWNINTSGVITGFYGDSNGVVHGFVRSKTGTITTFDAPGAGNLGILVPGGFEMSINTAGDIAGYYLDSGSVFHGYLRTP